jgi:YfiH family protein
MSTKLGSRCQDDFEMNLSYKVGDNPTNVDKNRKSFFSSLGVSENELAIPLQIHSATVLVVDAPGEFQECDALITDTNGIALVVTVADCVPIMLFDPGQKVIGIVHAGWRGTADKIVMRTVEKMQEKFGTETKNILAYIGPSAGSCCYEVSKDVAVKFENKIVPCNTTKIFVDLKKENAAQLQKQGVRAEDIEVSTHCTICENQLFHSYRRDGRTSGRMMAVMCQKP